MSDYPYFPGSMLYPLEGSEFIGFALPTGQMQKGRAWVCSALSVARVGPRVALCDDRLLGYNFSNRQGMAYYSLWECDHKCLAALFFSPL